jgi:hypothetical protein
MPKSVPYVFLGVLQHCIQHSHDVGYIIIHPSIFVNLREGEKNPKKQIPKKKDKKKKQIRNLRFFCPFLFYYFLIQKKD